MMAPVSSPLSTSAEDFSSMWRRQQTAWHVVYAAVWLSAVAVTLLDEAGPRGVWLEIAALVGMAVAYAVAGAPALAQQSVGSRALVYHLVSWPLLLAVTWLNPGTETWILFFILFPHLWAMLSTRWAAIGTGLAVAAFGVLRWLPSDRSGQTLVEVVISSLISLGLSLALGVFINRIVHEAESRAETIDELRATQARLVAAERDRGVHEERERLSREIHDTLAQGFTSVVALARASQSALARGDVQVVASRLALIEQTGLDNLSEARLIVAELSPSHLQSGSLVAALERLAGGLRAEAGIEVSVEVTGDPVALGGATDVVLLRTAQEALSNVRRHSGARHTTLSLTYAADEVSLEVSDDGKGFSPQAPRSGFGLDGVHARVDELGGRVAVTSDPGKGTRLTVVVPR